MIDLNSLDDNSLAAWARNFCDKIKHYASTLGLSGDEVQNVESSSNTIQTIVGAANRARESGADPSTMRELLDFKQTILSGPAESLKASFPKVFTALATGAAVGVLPRLLGFIDKIKANPAVPKEVSDLLGADAATVDRIKGNDSDMLDWFGGLADKLKTHKSELGLQDSDVRCVENDYMVMDHLVKTTDEAAREVPNDPHLQELVKYKNLVMQGPSESLARQFPSIGPMALAAIPAVLPRLTSMIQGLMRGGNFTEAIGRELGITGETREPVGAAAGRGRAEEERRPQAPEPTKPSWLLQLLLLGLAGLLAYVLWPKAPQVARAPSEIEKKLPSRPSDMGAGPRAVLPQLAISKVKVTPADNGAVVTWVTNRPSTGQMEYGETDALEMGISPRASLAQQHGLTRSHSMRLMGLERGNTYRIRIVSRDKDGNLALSRVYRIQVP